MIAVIVISDLEFGGAQRQVIELANNLGAAGIEAHVCSLSDYVPLAKQLRGPTRLRVIRRTWRFDFTVVFRLAWFLRKSKADVVHGFLFDAEIASRLAGRLARRPAVIGSERNTDYGLKKSDAWFLKGTRSCQDVVVANSRSGADFNSTLMGYPRSRYRVIRNGVDVTKFQPRARGTGRQDLGIPEDALVVGMFASFKPQKNHALLLDAAKEILDRNDNLRFLFVGDALYKGMSDSDTYKKTLAAKVDELGIRDRCVFAGNRSDVERMYPLCDLTVLPSLFEGTPNVLLESMACGVPVVATDVSDNRDLVPDGEVGFLVPSGDIRLLKERILELLGSPTLRESMSRRSRDWVVQEFSSERLAARTAAVYREAVVLKSGHHASR